jgi:hypothetical protein
VYVDHNGIAACLARSDCEGFRSVVYPMQWMGLLKICCGMAVMRMGIVGVSVRKMKALTVKRETVTLIGKGGLKLTFLFLGVVLDLYNTFFCGRCVLFRACCRLESSCIWVNVVCVYIYRGADKSLAQPKRKQATATEDFEFHISHI